MICQKKVNQVKITSINIQTQRFTEENVATL